ncbi:MAG: DUF3611 family protein [Gammaproteobacteria bacterium]
MTKVRIIKSWPPTEDDGLPDLFRRIGRFGVLSQLAIITVDAAFMVYVLIIRGLSEGVGFREIVVMFGLAIMLVTTYIFFRYRQFGQRMLSLDKVPEFDKVVSALWFGLWVSFAGIVLSLLLLFTAVSRLALMMLAAPQSGGALPLAPVNVGFLSALDGVSLMGSLIVLTVELVLVGLTLWLLFCTSEYEEYED